MNLKQIGGDIDWKEYGGKFASKKLNNGEFNYWLVAEFINFEEATGDSSNGRYMVSIDAVSPQVVSDQIKKDSLYSIGREDVDPRSVKEEQMMSILSEDGIGATIWSESGDNADDLMKKARKEADKISMMFGFYMDRQLNFIGNTGWDFIRGDIGFKGK